MRISRGLALTILNALDQWVPPRLRDSKWFMYVPMRLVLKHHVGDFMTFKQAVFQMSPGEFAELYRRTSTVGSLHGVTDLNQACIDAILSATKHDEVLDVGCGRGFLANLLSDVSNVTACDIVIGDDLPRQYPKVRFVEGSIESLPFGDDAFGTVVCTHTLEHVQDLPKAVAELRRVARRQLIVVVPKQRPYLYNFNLHTQFFPYAWSLRGALGHREGAVIKDLGDWYYEETFDA